MKNSTTLKTSCRLYRSIDKLPLSVFIDVSVDDDLQALVIEGEASDSELIALWEDLYQQYVDAIGDSEQQHYLRLLKKVNDLKTKLYLIHLYVSQLKDVYVLKWADDLNKLVAGRFAFNPDNQEQYEKDLSGCVTRSKGVQIELSIAEKQLEELQQAKPEGSTKPTRAYYDQLLVAISDFKKREISEQITVSKFCIMLRQLNNYYQQTKNKK